MRYHVHVTVNGQHKEWEYPKAECDSLDELMYRIRRVHPEYTSVLLAVVTKEELQPPSLGQLR